MCASAAVCIILIELDCASQSPSPWKHEICHTCQVLITTSYVFLSLVACFFVLCANKCLKKTLVYKGYTEPFHYDG